MVEMIAETSKLDPEEDIKYRDYGIPEIKDILPKAKNGNEPIPKSVLLFFCRIEWTCRTTPQICKARSNTNCIYFLVQIFLVLCRYNSCLGQ